jgi:hypothetical protein
MAGMGPAPKAADQRRRRNARPASLQLPAAGRTGKTPAWPLPKEDAPLDALERKLWAELWRLPQAIAWERFGYGREVAQYVRWKVRAELGSLDASKEARQLSDRLGLSPLALRRLEWEIVPDELAVKREERSASAKRVKAVDLRAVAGS